VSLTLTHFKLVVGDAAAAERFYAAIGFICTSRAINGEGDLRQAQHAMSTPGAPGCTMILCQFLNCPPPPRPAFPGEAWLILPVPDADKMADLIVAEGGSILRPGHDNQEHKVRAVIAADPEGHHIELVSPLRS
jgi:predicted enzyme related to lactoylglutathione lyase